MQYGNAGISDVEADLRGTFITRNVYWGRKISVKTYSISMLSCMTKKHTLYTIKE